MWAEERERVSEKEVKEVKRGIDMPRSHFGYEGRRGRDRGTCSSS